MERPPRLGSIPRAAGLVLAGLAVCFSLGPAQADGQHVRGDPTATDPSEWMTLDQALEGATRTGRPVFVYVHASWCAPCHRLERDVFPHLKADLAGIITAAIDVSESPDPGFRDTSREWTRVNGLDTPPAFALVTADGGVLAALTGYHPATVLRQFLLLGNDLASGR